MSIKSICHKVKGFTLVELLVVIAIIALLVAIVFPAISNALLRGRVTATSVNGRNIHQAIVAAQVADVYISTASPFPDSSSTDRNFANSTQYFTFLVTGRVLNVAWSFFAPPGVPAAREMAQFNADRNGWCVVDQSENMPDTAPFLFTKNLNITALQAPSIPSALVGQPFIDKGFAFVTRGGAAFALVGDDVSDEARFRGLFITERSDTGADLGNTVIRP